MPESTVISASPAPKALRKSRVAISTPAAIGSLVGVLAEGVVCAGIFAQIFRGPSQFRPAIIQKNHFPF
jgi:hypothetical protein